MEKVIYIKQATKKGYIACKNGGVFDCSYPTSKLRRGRVQGGGEISPTITCESGAIVRIEIMNERFKPKVLAHMPGRNMCSANVYDKNNICQSLMACMGTGGNNQPFIKVDKYREEQNMEDVKTENQETKEKYAIRKLTPKECFRLMNFSDEDFEKAKAVNSNSQLYKQAGNSIVVACLIAIFSQLGIQGKKRWNEMNLEERRALVYKGTILEGKNGN
ncbi:MAG: DNA cytosine methyltransferase [Methanobrevibacter sp.]|nr:DNA cytosine methyltransferase [Methanobrevibacter sp.]MBP5785305.1 DNA cytosine methyltransferase [Methanobrevibacter sp.]